MTAKTAPRRPPTLRLEAAEVESVDELEPEPEAATVLPEGQVPAVPVVARDETSYTSETPRQVPCERAKRVSSALHTQRRKRENTHQRR